MSILAITQARFGSTRFPGKILKEIGGISLLEIQLRRVLGSKKITHLIVATTSEPEALQICAIAKRIGIAFYQGSTDDVLDRFYQAAKAYKNEHGDLKGIVRMSSDCPLMDPTLIDSTIDKWTEAKVDYASISRYPSFPLGVDHEIFTFAALERAWREAKLASEREHVTPYIWKNCGSQSGAKFSTIPLKQAIDQSQVRMVVDYPQDFEVIKALVEALGWQASWQNYTNYLLQHPELMKLNADIHRDTGYLKSLQNDQKK